MKMENARLNTIIEAPIIFINKKKWVEQIDLHGEVKSMIKRLEALNNKIEIFTHLKLCLATATHNFKWVKITKFWIKAYIS